MTKIAIDSQRVGIFLPYSVIPCLNCVLDILNNFCCWIVNQKSDKLKPAVMGQTHPQFCEREKSRHLKLAVFRVTDNYTVFQEKLKSPIVITRYMVGC